MHVPRPPGGPPVSILLLAAAFVLPLLSTEVSWAKLKPDEQAQHGKVLQATEDAGPALQALGLPADQIAEAGRSGIAASPSSQVAIFVAPTSVSPGGGTHLASIAASALYDAMIASPTMPPGFYRIE